MFGPLERAGFVTVGGFGGGLDRFAPSWYHFRGRGVCAGGASGSQSEQYRSAGRSAGQSRWKRTKGQLLRRPIAGGETAITGGEWLTDNTVGLAYVADVRLAQTEE